MATKTVTAVGNAQIDTAQSKFGGASGLFDGTGDCLTTPDNADFAFGSGDFTIDCWFRMAVIQNSMIYEHFQDGNNFFNLFFWNTGGGKIALNVLGAGAWVLDFNCPFAAVVNTWHHFEITRSGNTWYVFFDGVEQTKTLVSGSYSNAMPDFTGTIYIGAQDTGGTTLNGWFDEYRVSKGVARHTANFTPSASAYTSDANTVLLLHMDGADASTTFTDDSLFLTNANFFQLF